MNTCGAKTRSGGPCKRAPLPNGRCNLHGGKSLAGTESPTFKHGRTSRYRHLLADKLAAHVSDHDDPLDLLPELEVQRALFAAYLNSYNAPGMRIPADESERLIQWATEITRTAERITKLRNETALTKAEVAFIAARIPDVVMRYIDDPDKQQRFLAELFGVVGGVPAGEPALTQGTAADD